MLLSVCFEGMKVAPYVQKKEKNPLGRKEEGIKDEC